MESLFQERRQIGTLFRFMLGHKVAETVLMSATYPQLCAIVWLSPFLSHASSKVSGVVLNCINMQEFIDCLPWHFCREGKRVLQSPSALITGSWQCYLSLVKDKPRHQAVTQRAEGAHLLGSLQEEGCLWGLFTLICLMCWEP